MKILFLTDNFPPESNAPATRTYEHCFEWVSIGYEVTVITCNPNFPSGKIYNGYSNKIYSKEDINGIKVIRVWSYISANKGFIKRTLDYLSFAFTSFFFGLFVKADIIIATSPQFFTAVSGSFLSLIKNKPWIMEVRDLWPDSIVAVGSMSSKSKSYKFLKKIEGILYNRANKIIVVTNSFKDYLINYHDINSSKIGVFKNGVKLENLKKTSPIDLRIIKDQLGLNNKIIISYIGTHGLAHALKFIIDTTQKVKNKKLHFLFVGDGAQKQDLVDYSKSLKNKNFTFIDSVSKSKVYDFVNLSDFALVNLKKSDEFKNVIPSKIFENIALYKPILLGVEGEAKYLIQRYDVGICFEPENETSFLSALEGLDKIDFKKFKVNCDKMILDFNRKSIANKMINFIVKDLTPYK
jgi:glycosyltransferase involved in cell wall biosynthesis